MDPLTDPVAIGEQAERSEAPNRFAISTEELERSSHVPLDEQIVEVPATGPTRVPGDDDVTRALGGLINPGV